MNRRELIKQGCMACIAIGAGVSLFSLASCNPMPIVKTEIQQSFVFIDPMVFKDAINKVLIRVKSMEFDILLFKQEQSYKAIYMQCSHQNFPLNSNSKKIFCNSHGSEFNFEGKVIMGPATRDLKMFKTEYNESSNRIKITISYMILIADSGSTKTDWRLVGKQNEISQLRCSGFNPYFHKSDEISEEIERVVLPLLDPDSIKKVFYYGAGCSTEEKCDVIRVALQQCFPVAEIFVHHDLLGAARALCGKEPGIAAILGTGSNSCFFDGKEIVENVASLGFILGDEGSGAYLGRKFIKAYLDRELEEEIELKFFSEYKLDKDLILKFVYSSPNPNRFLASFAIFIFQHFHHPSIYKMVADSFRDFFDKHICKYEQYKSHVLHCTGSVGYYFSDVFKSIALEKNVRLGKIVEAPIELLTNYHIQNQIK